MAAPKKDKPAPKWVIDLHGVKAALTTRSNEIRARIIDAIQCGEMLVLRSVQDDLKNAYPKLWPDFVAIKPKAYLTTSMAEYAAATALQEGHGSGILGGMPSFMHFEAVSVAHSKKCCLISDGTALKHCKKIAKGCGLPDNTVAGIDAV